LGIRPTTTTSINIDGTWVGERKDWGGVTLGSYTLVNLAGSRRLSSSLEVFGRVQNLLDEEYEEAGGYGTPGRSAYLGIRADL
jgi:outer membrane cobalamin receptor